MKVDRSKCLATTVSGTAVGFEHVETSEKPRFIEVVSKLEGMAEQGVAHRACFRKTQETLRIKPVKTILSDRT